MASTWDLDSIPGSPDSLLHDEDFVAASGDQAAVWVLDGDSQADPDGGATPVEPAAGSDVDVPAGLVLAGDVDVVGVGQLVAAHAHLPPGPPGQPGPIAPYGQQQVDAASCSDSDEQHGDPRRSIVRRCIKSCTGLLSSLRRMTVPDTMQMLDASSNEDMNKTGLNSFL